MLVTLLVASQLQGCESGAVDNVTRGELDAEQQLLAYQLYGRSDAILYWWPSLEAAPPSVQRSAAYATELVATLPHTDVGAFSITYASNNLPQNALWIRRAGNAQLLVYNHGHSGLPEATEQYASRFLQLAIQAGHDILLTSMPLTGINTPLPDIEYQVRTSDIPGLATVDPTALEKFFHSLYEIIEDPDLYMHYFIDAAVIPVSFLSQASWQVPGISVATLGNALPLSPGYVSVSYVGLSGGANSGLTACAVLSLRRCVLIAGVMPNDLRVRDAKNFGDAEQLSRSIYQHFSVGRLLRLANYSTDALVLLFNDKDSCCFADPTATDFKWRYPEYDIRVLPLAYHGYEPETVIGILGN